MLLPKVQAEYPIMPASRPYWKGYLKLSLVSCPIALYTASASSERVSFRQVNKKTGNRLRQQLVDDVTRESVEAADKGRGYEVAKNTFILIDDEELDAIAIESTHTIEIDSFVPRAQIDERYFESPYYIVPNDQVGQEAFEVIREAMPPANVPCPRHTPLRRDRRSALPVSPAIGPTAALRLSDHDATRSPPLAGFHVAPLDAAAARPRSAPTWSRRASGRS
jgi:non-homologous end joining protein Ku